MRALSLFFDCFAHSQLSMRVKVRAHVRAHTSRLFEALDFECNRLACSDGIT
jgi:hypothetical protein